MKVISMFLPQFHRIKENDEWWGNGFTEWTAVKKAEPLFDKHNQPRRPLNDNYYNLLDKETMLWQAKLMKEYGIDGQCIYHYYFKDGKKVLEKPAENLLKWKDIDMPFCFSWANESWIRSWSNIYSVKGNPWFEKFDNDFSSSKDGILLEQDYGDANSWKDHFEYLSHFFEDKRYIKIDGHPLFLILSPKDISCLDDMIECWKKLSFDRGVPTPYIVGCNTPIIDGIDSVLMTQPQTAIGLSSFKERTKSGIRKYSYDELWQNIIQNISKQNEFISGFVDYDDTPRRGNNGCVIVGSTPWKFSIYINRLIEKAKQNGIKAIFINAWNEWGEGMYLEPDVSFGYDYLAALKDAKSVSLFSNKIESQDEHYSTIKLSNKIEQYRGYWQLFDKWLRNKENGRSIFDNSTLDNGDRISIYGIGMIGEHLISEMRANNISVEYGIDISKKNTLFDFPIYHPEDDLPDTDVIIVTVPFEYADIRNKLLDKVKDARIISIEALL